MHRKCLRMCTSRSRREYLVSFRMAIIMKMLCVKGDLISYKSSFKSHKLPTRSSFMAERVLEQFDQRATRSKRIVLYSNIKNVII